MSVVPNVANKKRKKTESKPQSQLNKCLNEKRRREQENIYIEELAELISASTSDMSSLSVKPDKCAILQETVSQIRRINEPGQSDDLQQSEVSSSKPTILANDILGPLLLEALDGFLFMVNTDGKIEFVSENITSFLKYSQDDLVEKNIYNIVHVGDHARFSSSLLPMMSLGNGCGWTPEPNTGTSKSRSFNCRFLIKPPDDRDETMEEKQNRVSQYENMQVSAVLLPFPGERTESTENDNDIQNRLVCVARRIPPNEKSPTSLGVEQFTTRLDVTGKIIAIDTSGVSSTYSQYLNKELVGCIIQELCHPSDLQKLNHHLKETLQSGSNTSNIYRLRVAQERYVCVQTKSKRFNFSQATSEQEFIMATHSIIRDNDGPVPLESNQRSNPSPTTHVSASASSGSVALASSVNGGVGGSSLSLLGSYNAFPSLSPNSHEFGLNDLVLDTFPSSSWNLDHNTANRDSDGLSASSFVASSPQSTLSSSNRTVVRGANSQPTNSAFSPGLMASKSSSSNPSPSTPGRATTPFSSSLNFSPTQAQPVLDKLSPSCASSKKNDELIANAEVSVLDVTNNVTSLMREEQMNGQANQKLRNLLTQNIEDINRITSKEMPNDRISISTHNIPDTDSSSQMSQSVLLEDVSQASVSGTENIILRELLNQDDEDMTDNSEKADKLKDSRVQGLLLSAGIRKVDSGNQKRLGSNDMLRKLLNNDDIDRHYPKSQDLILIQQLLKANSPDKNENSNGDRENQASEDTVPKPVTLDSGHASPGMSCITDGISVKRKVVEKAPSNHSAPKRQNVGAHHAHLAGQNPMLASMLAQTPRTPPSVPTSIANSIMSQLPQERLPKNLEKKLVHTPYTTSSTTATTSTTTQVLSSHPTNRNILTITSVQQDVVTSDSRGHITHHPAINQPSGMDKSSFSQQPQGFLSKILSSTESVQMPRSLSLASVPGNLSQQSLQTANFLQQFTQSVSENSSSSSRGLRDMLGDSTSAESSTLSPSIQTSQSSDPVLSEILEQVWSLQEEMNMGTVTSDEDNSILRLLDALDPPPTTFVSQAATPTVQDINEKIAISAIQKQLMSFEGTPTSVVSTSGIPPNPGTIPLYSQAGHSNSSLPRTSPSQLSPNSVASFSSVHYPPGSQPPSYPSSVMQRVCVPVTIPAGSILANSQHILGIAAMQRIGLPQYSGSNVSPQMKRSLLERRQKYLQQQQKRLLAQQQQQQLTMQTQQPLDGLSPAGSAPFPENMNDLLNNTVAPNVTLQRSSSVPEQLSPRYNANMMGQLPSPIAQSSTPSQLSPNQRVSQQSPFSPLSQPYPSPTPPATNYQQSRLSPHSLPSYPQGGPSHSPSPVPSGVTGGSHSPHLQLSPQQGSGPPQWNQRPPQSPLQNNLQQQNPMLNAQLSQQGTYNSGQTRFTAQQRQMPLRSMPSPGSVQGSRNSPFSAQADVSYPPLSPVGVYQGQQSQQQSQQQQQQQRLQRTVSVPGRVNSPRTQGGYIGTEPVLSPQPQQSPSFSQSVPSTPSSAFVSGAGHTNPSFSLSPDSSHFTFDQQNLQIFTSGCTDRTRVANSVQVSSDYVRQELRAVVGARTQQQQQSQSGQGHHSHQQGLHTLATTTATTSVGPSPTSQPLSRADLEVLGLTLEPGPNDVQTTSQSLFSQSLLSIAGSSENPTSARGCVTSPRVEEAKPNNQKKSLLQQLLSEPS